MRAPLHKRSLSVGLFAVIILVCGVWALKVEFSAHIGPARAEIERSVATGERLELDGLKAGESITIAHLSRGHGRSNAWTYQIEGDDAVRLVVIEHEPYWTKEARLAAGKILSSEAVSLTKNELTSLTLYWKGIRIPVPVIDPRYYDTFEVEYFRTGKKIGQEKIGANAARYFYWRDPYYQLPPQLADQISEEQWNAVRSFEEIMQERKKALIE